MVYTGLPILNDVFLVEGLAADLISISQLCDQGLKVMFTKTTCFVTDENNNVVMKGDRSSDNCYLWKPEVRSKDCENYYYRRKTWKSEPMIGSQISSRTDEYHLNHFKDAFVEYTDRKRYSRDGRKHNLDNNSSRFKEE